MAEIITLFDKYSKNYNFLISHISEFRKISNKCINGEEFYVCPLSRRIYAKSLLFKKNGKELTKEHVPPKSLGGKEVCLTAKDYNNKSTSIDICVKERTDRIVANKLGKPQIYKGRIDGKYKLDVWIDKEKPNIYFKQMTNNPKLEEFAKETFTKNAGKFELTLQLKGETVNTCVKKGYLKILYLLSFSTFGYAFLYNTKGIANPIIKIISDTINSKDHDIKLPYVFEFDYDDELDGFNFVLNKNGEVALFICVRIGGFNKVMGIFPGPNETNQDFYLNFINNDDYYIMKMNPDNNLDLSIMHGALYYWGIWTLLPKEFD
jgi:hypothetical protein